MSAPTYGVIYVTVVRFLCVSRQRGITGAINCKVTDVGDVCVFLISTKDLSEH